MIKAVVYDFDGVIADSFPAVYHAYKKIAQELKLDFPQDIEGFRALYGKNYIECMQNLKIAQEDQARAKQMFSASMEEAGYLPFQGIDEVLSVSAKNHNLYLLSASSPGQLKSFLKKHEFDAFFQEIISAMERRERKAVLMQELIKKLSITPEEIISIGDRVTDYIAAKKNLIPDENIILTAYGWGLDRQAFPGVNIVDSPIEILELIKKINKKYI